MMVAAGKREGFAMITVLLQLMVMGCDAARTGFDGRARRPRGRHPARRTGRLYGYTKRVRYRFAPLVW
jgi:hypothetical protein